MATSNYKNSSGTDLGSLLVEKSYLIDRYPELVDQYRFAGLWGWGNNGNGQLGTNDIIHRSAPVQTVAYSTNWKQIAGGQTNTFAIKTDGTLWGWGNNFNGYLGTGDTTTYSSPVQTVTYGTNWKQVDTYGCTAAIKTDGTLWMWGPNTYGQLGTNDITHRSSPIQTIAYGTNWKQVSVGSRHCAAIKTDGTLWGWGEASNSQLGLGADFTSRSSPIQTIAYGTNWKQVSCGEFFSMAIKGDGTLWGWGFNFYGQLGNNSFANTSSPIQTITFGTNWKQVSCGDKHTAAVKTDGTLWVWGHNAYGQLGAGFAGAGSARSSPVQTVAYGTNWRQVSCSEYFHIAAIKTDGTLWGWGRNPDGTLGTNNTTNYSSPVQTVTYGTNWKQVACGYKNTIAIKDDSEDLW